MATTKNERELEQMLNDQLRDVEQIRDVNDQLRVKEHQIFEFKATIDQNEARALEQDECVQGLRAESTRLQEELVSANELLGCARLLAAEYITQEELPAAPIPVPIPEPRDQL